MAILIFLLVSSQLSNHDSRFTIHDSHPSITISGNEIADSAIIALTRQLSNPNSQILTVSPIRIPPSISLPNKDYKFQTATPNPFPVSKYSRATLVWVNIIHNNKTVKSVPVPLKVRFLAPMVIAKSRIKKHMILSPDNVCIKLKECDATIHDSRFTIHDVFGKRTKKTIGKEQVLTPDMIETLPLVNAQKPVKIIYNHHTVAISTTGFAQEDGWLYDFIKIQLFDKIIIAKVVRANCVSII